jgi:hypothetical protein
MSCSYIYFTNKNERDDEELNPVVRIGHICESYGKYILVWGGQRFNLDSAADSLNKNLIWIFDTEFEKWFLNEIQLLKVYNQLF